MALEEVHIGDIGTALRLVVEEDGAVVDVSTASAKLIILKKPHGTRVEKTASFTTDGTDGKIQYATISGDIDEAGTWQYQGKVTIGSNVWYTEIAEFEVFENL